jgi:NDP-sugar pyrophosphorylase family protein
VFLMLPMAILCGGLGTRLGDLTKDTPKCLVDVNGKPFLVYVLEEAARQGITKVVLCVGHLAEQVRWTIGNGSHLGLEVAYSRDGEQSLGTAGALLSAASLLDEDFFVLYGDSYLTVDYAAVQAAYEAQDCLGLMTVCEPPPGYRPNVRLGGLPRRVVAHDKHWPPAGAHHIDYGLGILDHRALSVIDSTPYDLSDLYGSLADCGELAGYVSPERFYTIGTPVSLALTTEVLGARVPRVLR